MFKEAFSYLKDNRQIQMSKQEAKELWNLSKDIKDNRTILEIGRLRGGSLCIMLLASKARLVSFDISDRWVEKVWENIDHFGIDRNRVSLVQSAFDVSSIDYTVDMAYIDGDHSYEGVEKDLLNVMKVVKSKGVVAFHDYVPSKKARSKAHLAINDYMKDNPNRLVDGYLVDKLFVCKKGK